MRFTFEPGDGSFEIYLDPTEEVLPKYNLLGNAIWRLDSDSNNYVLIKTENQILDYVKEGKF